MKTEYTKGHWKLNQFSDCIASENILIAERPHGGEGLKNWENNSRLISAAPDLLEACKLCFERLSDNNMIEKGSYNLTVILQKAIRKAEGNLVC